MVSKQALVVAAMARKCCDLLEGRSTSNALPRTLQPDYLLWMANQIAQHTEVWPATKLHRWIGYLQGGMVANQILDFDGAKAMFQAVRKVVDGIDVDQDLIDHLDPENPFRLEMGGEA